MKHARQHAPSATGAKRGTDRIWTSSNMLSMLRLLLTVPLVLLILAPVRNTAAILLLALAAYGSDLLDGWLARRFDGETTFGRFIDPVADKVLVGACAAALLAAGLVPPWYVAAVLARDLLILAGGAWVRARTGRVVQSNYTGKAAVVSIAAVLLASLFPDSLHGAPFALLQVTSLGLMAASLALYGSRAVPLLRRGGRH